MLPFELYRNDPNWVAPLIMDMKNMFNPKKNPYYTHSEVQLYLAFDNNKLVGRVSAHTNRQHNAFHQDKVGFFGFYESINDNNVCTALLDAASEWLLLRDCDTLRGPLHFSTNDESGLLVDGFDSPPFIMMPHHHPYYQNLMTNYGMTKVMDLYAYLSETKTIPANLESLALKLQQRGGFTIRTLSKDKINLRKDIATVFGIYQKAWENNWGFVPLNKEEFDHTVEQLLPIVDRDLVFIAEINGVPAGFSVSTPNYNFLLKKMNGRLFPTGIFKMLYYKNKINSARCITMGVVKEFQNRGIDLVFYYYSFVNGIKRGFYRSEFSWVLENNVMMNRIAGHLGAHVYKTYRIYDKHIGNDAGQSQTS